MNKGNCETAKGNLEAAKELFLEATNIDSLCIEAIYNLGLVYKREEDYEKSLQMFHKINHLKSKI